MTDSPAMDFIINLPERLLELRGHKEEIAKVKGERNENQE